MSRSYKSITQYYAIKDFFLKLSKIEIWEILKKKIEPLKKIGPHPNFLKLTPPPHTPWEQ